MSITFSHQRRRSDRRDWLQSCTPRTGLLICCLSAAIVSAAVIVACGAVS